MNTTYCHRPYQHACMYMICEGNWLSPPHFDSHLHVSPQIKSILECLNKDIFIACCIFASICKINLSSEWALQKRDSKQLKWFV